MSSRAGAPATDHDSPRESVTRRRSSGASSSPGPHGTRRRSSTTSIKLEAPGAEGAHTASEDGEPEKPPPPPVLSRMYCVPRDFRRTLEINAVVGSKEVRTRLVGPERHDKSKYIACAKSFKSDEYYCVPYDSTRILEINPETNKVKEVGRAFTDLAAKYTALVSSTNFHGRMYAAPCRAQKLLEIDPLQGTFGEVGPQLGSRKHAKWWGIANSCTGRLYAVPYDARRVLEIDPNKRTAREIGPDLGPEQAKYICVTEAPNGNLYAPPFNASRVLQIDSNGHVKLVGMDFGIRERKYACIVCAPNSLLYSPPLYADKVLEINCARGDTREIGEVLGCGEAKYACAAVEPVTGRIFCAPLEARKVLEIDPPEHEAKEIGLDLGGHLDEKYSAIVAAPGGLGKLYAAPRNAHFVLEVDAHRTFVREVGQDLGRCHRKFSCIVPGTCKQEEPKPAQEDSSDDG